MDSTIENKRKDRLAKALALLYMGSEYLHKKHEPKEPSKKSNATNNRRFVVRKSWDSFQQKLTKTQFRKYFRMEKECFKLLVSTVEGNIGVENFKSEAYIQSKEADSRYDEMYNAHKKSTGGIISGEIKLALTLRLLAGGSYMDLALLFEVSFSYSYTIFHHVVFNWILPDNFMGFKGLDYIEDVSAMDEVCKQFAAHSDGIFSGCIGALDGWIVKIIRPNEIKDKVKDPASYYTRKGYYGINVQVIVDRKKKVLYRSIKCRGAEHDSSSFKASSMYNKLMAKSSWLQQNGYYFIGDSAYALRYFLLTPFD